MIVRRLGIVVAVLAVGVGIGLAMPSWRVTTSVPAQPAHDSDTVPADLCTGTHFTGKTTILLK